MEPIRVYVADGLGDQSEDIEAFVVAVLSGTMEEAYRQRFGHFGPKGFLRDNDPSPLAPQGLEELEDDGELPAPDIWE